MRRDIEQTTLPAWQMDPRRKPLLIRGARQVGKTHAIRSFGRSHFSNLVELNFELRPELKKIFAVLDPKEIIRNISLVLGQRIEVGSTLLFLDEIQECPQAIMALRYFFEELPALHVIGAGSLLEFVLDAKGFTMPVGRVQYLHMQPLSFEEFLTALEETLIRDALKEMAVDRPFSEAVHDKLLKRLREYLIIGGMPAVVTRFLEDATSNAYQTEQLSILQTYRDDFGKYSSRIKQAYLQTIFNTAPGMVGKRYKYAHVDPHVQARELKEALTLLCRAGVVQKVVAASGHGLPFQRNEGRFKIVSLDVGLMQRGCGLDAEIAGTHDLLGIHAGAVAEQFVGQELLAHINPYEERALHFWVREKSGSAAEIDYLVTHRSRIVPIEVKSGKTGTLRSLRLFLAEHKAPVGVRVSQLPLSLHDGILSVPLYAISQLPRLVSTAMA